MKRRATGLSDRSLNVTNAIGQPLPREREDVSAYFAGLSDDGRAPPQGSYFPFGSGIRFNASL
jgi:hypothetical protein